jgi:hypothetical protein
MVMCSRGGSNGDRGGETVVRMLSIWATTIMFWMVS